MKNLCHPAIPLIYDVEEDSHSLFIIEQYMEGESLSSLCKDGCLSENQVIDLGIQICDIITYLHQNNPPILYLDLKPDNIIVNHGQAALIDFGSAAVLDGRRIAVAGTEGFAAPEQRNGTGVSKRSDIYGIGRLMLYMLTGKGSLEADKIADICSGALAAIIKKCLRELPAARFRCAKTVSRHLKAILSNDISPVRRIAVAGVSSNVGTTHVSIMLTALFNKHYKSSCYVECNENEAAKRLAYERKLEPDKGCFFVGSMKFVLKKASEKICEADLEDHIVVCDCGVLNYDNLQDFLSADVSCLVGGCKPWEFDELSQAYEMCHKGGQFRLIFNFADEEQAAAAGKWLGTDTYFCVPFAADPFDCIRDRDCREFFEQLMM